MSLCESDVKQIDYLIVLKKKSKTAATSNADSGRDTLEICGPGTPAAQEDAILQDDFARRVLASLPVSIFVLCLASRDLIYRPRLGAVFFSRREAESAELMGSKLGKLIEISFEPASDTGRQYRVLCGWPGCRASCYGIPGLY
jgi:hypothetical protein